MDYPKELFHHERGVSRVTFGPEEHANLIADEGYSDEREPGKQYRVHTATTQFSPSNEEAKGVVNGESEAEPAAEDPATPEPPRARKRGR